MECSRCDYYKAHNCKHQCMDLPELYTALCLLWGVEEIKDEYAILLGEVVLEVINGSNDS